MSAEQLFSLLNTITLLAWLALILLPRVRWTSTVVPVALAAALSAIYGVLIGAALARTQGGFGSLAAVRTLFQSDVALLAGWTHYLAFDLLIGAWEVRDARSRHLSHLLVAPALVLTFLVGPAGFLLYLSIRTLSTAGTASTAPSRPSNP